MTTYAKAAEVGEGYNPFDERFTKDPHAFFARARAEAPVCYSPIFDMWLVTRYEDVMTVLDDPVVFSSKNKGGPPPNVLPEVLEILEREGYLVVGQLFNSDPPEHTRMRTLFMKGFTPARIEAMEPVIRQFAHELLDGFAAEGRADLRPRFTDLLPMAVVLTFIGVPREDHLQVRRWNDAWADLFAKDSRDDQLTAVREVVAYQKYYEALIEERRARPRDDLISIVANARVDGLEPLSTAELVWQLMGLMAAGQGTTTEGMSNLLLLLLRDRDRWRALEADHGLIPGYVTEALRVVDPVLGLPRVTTEDVELGGVSIPAGAQLLVVFASANRDAETFDEPDRFDPERPTLAQNLNFGRGTHYCIGGRLARLEISVALDVLLDRLPNLRLEDGFDPDFLPHPFLWGPARLPGEWDVPAR
jgi:cytochrome P450